MLNQFFNKIVLEKKNENEEGSSDISFPEEFYKGTPHKNKNEKLVKSNFEKVECNDNNIGYNFSIVSNNSTNFTEIQQKNIGSFQIQNYKENGYFT